MIQFLRGINTWLEAGAALPAATALLLAALGTVVPTATGRSREGTLGIASVVILTLAYVLLFYRALAPMLALAFAVTWLVQRSLENEIEARGRKTEQRLREEVELAEQRLESARARLAVAEGAFQRRISRYDLVRNFGNSLRFDEAWTGIRDACIRLLGGPPRLWMPRLGAYLPSGLYPPIDGLENLPDGDWRTAAGGRRVERARPDGRWALWIPLHIGAPQPAVLHLEIPSVGEDHAEAAEILANQVALLLEKIRLYHEVEHASRTDLLTGLPHHTSFKAILEEEVERSLRTQRPLSLLMCDIDHFKSVNDTYGHRVGDQVLVAIAHLLRNTLRVSDIIARYGGEEFAILLPATATRGACEIAERVRALIASHTIDAHTETEEHRIQRTVSIGIATLPDDARTAAELLERADTALYHAKRQGRDRVVASSASSSPDAGSAPPANASPHDPADTPSPTDIPSPTTNPSS